MNRRINTTRSGSLGWELRRNEMSSKPRAQCLRGNIERRELVWWLGGRRKFGRR